MTNGLIGGVLIGLASTLILIFNGRVTGISGIIGSLINRRIPDKFWRVAFLIGLILGGVTTRFLSPESFNFQTPATMIDYLVAGFLVGFGTLLGNGCTSGHGVCGISRFSVRSILATVTFIIFGVVSYALFKIVRGY